MTSICDRIAERRGSHWTTCRVFHGEHVLPRKEALAALNFRNIPDSFWNRANRDEALELLTDCLSHDLAYGTKVIPALEAQDLAAAFLGQFGPDVSFLTNTQKYAEPGAFGWEPISTKTFDTGILVEQDGVVGILWVQGED